MRTTLEGTQTNGEAMALHVKRELDVLAEATKGLGMSSLLANLAIQAVLADTGQLCSGSGAAGYAWQPDVYQKKSPHDPVGERVRAAGASLGRIMGGGHPTHRAYLAFMEAMYRVTTDQEDDVTRRIEELWDSIKVQPAIVLPVLTEPVRPEGVLARLWHRFLRWWRQSHGLEPEPPKEDEE